MKNKGKNKKRVFSVKYTEYALERLAMRQRNVEEFDFTSSIQKWFRITPNNFEKFRTNFPVIVGKYSNPEYRDVEYMVSSSLNTALPMRNYVVLNCLNVDGANGYAY
tara:strand:- start:2437 stop:2757 length:321 start_codon:yes stop_codon:yes gene_type:complete